VIALPEGHHVRSLLIAEQHLVALIFQIVDDQVQIGGLLVLRAVGPSHGHTRKQLAQLNDRGIRCGLMRDQPPMKLFMHEVRQQQVVVVMVAVANCQHRMAVRNCSLVDENTAREQPRH